VKVQEFMMKINNKWNPIVGFLKKIVETVKKK